MASSYYSKAHSTRDHFNEPPSILDRAISALPSGLAAHVQVLLDRQRYDGVSTNPSKSLRQIRRSLNIRRLLSVPHLLVAIWFVVLLWGERWVFRSSIEACEWDKWERWPKGATPHHLVFLADPQLVDPHAYPDRPWPLSTASILHTDNYLKRSYIQLQKQLVPDTLFFLGDLFDGGREWKTAHGNTDDPEWTKGLRPQQEERVLKTWRKKYGENFWLKEYDRFGKIFFKYWNLGTTEAGPGQRGRKVISSLPGNHDLGFGAQVKIPIRNRFEAYFGEGNRVDVIANHTFVSIDALSLSAGSSDRPASETAQITKPVDEFLSGVQEIKRRAVARELRYQSGDVRESQLAHGVQDLDGVDWSKIPKSDLGEGAAEFPTILLTHVPLYRNPDTPCGPMREHGGGISISKGYQYQNVLSESDSVRVVSSIGNVVSVFSGDDHDYCEIVHPPNKNSAREITVKSMSYVMGIRRPGFLMLSMWNPVTPEGKSKGMAGGHGAHPGVNTSPTFESHMCLLPDQIGILIRYGVLLAITFLTLCIRAVLTPILGLVPFDTPANESNRELSLLPTSNRDTKWEKDEDEQDRPPYPSSNSSTSSTASNPTCLAPRSSAQRQSRSVSPARGYGLPSSQVRNAVPPLIDSAGYIVNAYGGVQYPTRKEPPPKRVKTIAYDRGPKRKLSLPEKIGWEAIWSVWRVAWMVILVYLWLIKFPGSGG